VVEHCGPTRPSTATSISPQSATLRHRGQDFLQPLISTLIYQQVRNAVSVLRGALRSNSTADATSTQPHFTTRRYRDRIFCRSDYTARDYTSRQEIRSFEDSHPIQLALLGRRATLTQPQLATQCRRDRILDKPIKMHATLPKGDKMRSLWGWVEN
jgi:hypothetical protein